MIIMVPFRSPEMLGIMYMPDITHDTFVAGDSVIAMIIDKLCAQRTRP